LGIALPVAAAMLFAAWRLRVRGGGGSTGEGLEPNETSSPATAEEEIDENLTIRERLHILITELDKP